VHRTGASKVPPGPQHGAGVRLVTRSPFTSAPATPVSSAGYPSLPLHHPSSTASRSARLASSRSPVPPPRQAALRPLVSNVASARDLTGAEHWAAVGPSGISTLLLGTPACSSTKPGEEKLLPCRLRPCCSIRHFVFTISNRLIAMPPSCEVEASQPRNAESQTHEQSTSPLEPSTPLEVGPPESSQITLPSTEIPQSPIDPNESFKTEVDDRAAATVIPSSLTPPPSTQATGHHAASRRAYSNSQPATMYSPPATVPPAMRDRDVGSGYEPPSLKEMLDAPADDLRAMLQSSIAETQRLKMEVAHHKLQNNLDSFQADVALQRAAVEFEMKRREVEALIAAGHIRQSRQHSNTASEAFQLKYLRMQNWCEAASEELEARGQRLKVAKKVIQQKEEENIHLREVNEMLVNRIRENREHFQKFCSPGGLFHKTGASQHPNATPRQTSRSARREEREEHGLSALLQAMSQDHHNNNSAPSTPMISHRLAPRLVGKHHRNSQSLSSLPTTPMNRPRGEPAGLLPSVDLVPQSEPAHRYGQRHPVPTTPVARTEQRRRKSRESTISADDNEELARQAVLSAKAAQSFVSHAVRASHGGSPRDIRRDEEVVDDEITDSQATQAATEMLRRDPRQSFEAGHLRSSQNGLPGPMERTAAMSSKLLSHTRGMDKRKFSGNHGAAEDARHEPGSPAKKIRGENGVSEEQRRVGLGIQYQ
jgi:acetyl-CoA acyltransferase 1